MQVCVFDADKVFTEQLRAEMPEAGVWHNKLFDENTFPTFDYFVFNLDSTDFDTFIYTLNGFFNAFPDRIIVYCKDDETYERYSMHEPKAYTWWVMDIAQAIELIRMEAKPFVKQSELEN